LLDYYQSQKSAESDVVAQELFAFSNAMHRQGVKKIHLFAHSMGCRVVVSALSKSSVFEDLGTSTKTFGCVILSNPEVDLDTFKSSFDTVRDKCASLTVYSNSNDFALTNSECFNQTQVCLCQRRASLGRCVDPLYALDGTFHDLDIVNTTCVCSNVEEFAHSFFYISREMLEDIRELLVTKRRARDRTARLVQREASNVFDVCVAPGYVRGV